MIPRPVIPVAVAITLLALAPGVGAGGGKTPAVAQGPAAESSEGQLAELAAYMTGVFSSAEQAAADGDFRNVRLVMVPIWRERADGPWLYVEQAMAEALERPYRQRIYQLRPAGQDTVESVVYTLPGDPLRFAAGWRKAGLFSELAPQDLVERTGCAIRLLRRADGTWAGATAPESCPSDLRGAAFASSEVEIHDGLLISWDRGFDAEGKQVWGAEKGGYRFVKTQAAPPNDGT
ncbi:MAG: chromophore lyase CpcT/CpeT [Thermoanaerobaculia bacterium]|nr:chromophore lyase CpcT/CpeT [Thermoanaerobaculia bacterium]